jgi:hypothetical protein
MVGMADLAKTGNDQNTGILHCVQDDDYKERMPPWTDGG